MSIKEENLYTPNKFRTFTGEYINPFNATVDQINIKDISHALSNIPRFGGHLPEFYSVAQHSIACVNFARYCGVHSRKALRTVLLHDASEAYLLDIPKPIKKQIPNYAITEDHIMSIISEKFDIYYPLPPYVKDIDGTMLREEWYSLMLKTEDYTKLSNGCLTPGLSNMQAKESFYELFLSLQD